MRKKIFNRNDYCQLVYMALVDKRGPINLLPPALIKPKTLWSGKQVRLCTFDIWWFNFYLNVFWYHKKLNLYIYVCTFMWSVYYYRFYQPCFTTLFQKADKCSISQENQKSQKRWYTALLWWNWAKNVIEYFICEQKYLKLYSLLQNITVITLSCWISIL